MPPPTLGGPVEGDPNAAAAAAAAVAASMGVPTPDQQQQQQPPPPPPGKKKGRTNTPWTAEEEQRLKAMRDAGNTWSEIAKVRSS
jgi:hypothetical protein